VAVGEDDGADVCAVFNEVGDIGDDNVDAKEFGLGEHQSGIDDDDIVIPTERQAVHSEFAESAQGDDFQFFGLHLVIFDATTCARRCSAGLAAVCEVDRSKTEDGAIEGRICFLREFRGNSE